MRSKFKKVLFWCCAVCFVFATVQIGVQVRSYVVDYQTHQALLAQLNETPAATPNPQTDDSAAPDGASEPVESKYQSFYDENNDFVGWLSIPDTKLSYPVMQTVDEPEHYLHIDFYGEESASGTPFASADSSVNPNGDNIVIYGHNMKNGTMFKTIMSYAKQEFLQEHPIISFDTLTQEAEYEVIYVFYSDVTLGNGHYAFYNFTSAQTEEEFNEFTSYCASRSIYDTGLTAQYGDEFITLVTCSYHSENGRLAVVAKRIEK